MADTVTIPGMGPVKRVYLVAGGAVVTGIVGYAWWQRGRADAAAPPVVPPELVTGGERIPPVTGDSTQNVDLRDPETISTNAQWTQRATEYLATIGWEGQTVATALGKYLSRERLTTQEMDLVRAAVAAFGPPPVGGPYPIQGSLPDTPTPGGAPGPVNNLRVVRATHNEITIAWDPVDGATSYYITESSSMGSSRHTVNVPTLVHGGDGTRGLHIPNKGERIGLMPNLTHTYTVHAQNANGKSSGRTISGHTNADPPGVNAYRLPK